MRADKARKKERQFERALTDKRLKRRRCDLNRRHGHVDHRHRGRQRDGGRRATALDKNVLLVRSPPEERNQKARVSANTLDDDQSGKRVVFGRGSTRETARSVFKVSMDATQK